MERRDRTDFDQMLKEGRCRPEPGGSGPRGFRARLMAALAVLPCLFVTAPALAGGVEPVEKMYPPYPNVWGRKLLGPEGSVHGPTVVKNLDGDRFFMSSEPDGGPTIDTAYQTQTLTLFGGVTREIGKHERHLLYVRDEKTGEYPRLLDGGYIVLEGGDVIDGRSWLFKPGVCAPSYGRSLIRHGYGELGPLHKILFGPVKIEKILMQLYDRPRKGKISNDCGIAAGREQYIKRVQTFPPRFIPLADGTFMLPFGDFVVRFRADLTSPFVDSHPNLFLLDVEPIKAIVDKAYARPGVPIQNTNDDIRDYLIHLRREAGR